jgi:hypothetical protein
MNAPGQYRTSTAPVRFSPGHAESHNSAGRPGAIYSTPGNSLVNLQIYDVPVVSVPQLGHAVTDRSEWDGVH